VIIKFAFGTFCQLFPESMNSMEMILQGKNNNNRSSKTI
jgi:hypothetical protein